MFPFRMICEHMHQVVINMIRAEAGQLLLKSLLDR